MHVMYINILNCVYISAFQTKHAHLYLLHGSPEIMLRSFAQIAVVLTAAMCRLGAASLGHYGMHAGFIHRHLYTHVWSQLEVYIVIILQVYVIYYNNFNMYMYTMDLQNGQNNGPYTTYILCTFYFRILG